MSQVRRQNGGFTARKGWRTLPRGRGEDLMLFLGPDGERQPERELRERQAKKVCASCPVGSSA